MAEMANQSSTPVSDVMLARYLAGDLRGDQLARVERAITTTPGLAERLERMKQERDSFLRSAPADPFAHKVVTRLTIEKPAERAKWNVWWLMPPVSVAAALLFGVVYQQSLGPQSLAPSSVQTDDAYQLPEDARRTGGMPQKPSGDMPIEVASEPADAAKEESAKADPQGSVADRKVLSEKNKRLLQSARGSTDARAKDAQVSDRDGGGGGLGAVSGGSVGAGKGYAQPPEQKPALAKPESPRADSPPVWAAPPPAPPAQAPGINEERELRRDEAAATKAPARPAPEPAPAPVAPTTSAGPAANAAPAPKRSAKTEEAQSFDKAKVRSRAADDEADALTATPTSAAPAFSSQVTREQGGRPKALVSNEAIPVNAPLKVTAGGARYVTVIGVRRDGKPYIYGQGESPDGQAITLMVKLRPTSARIPEALFVVVGDKPLQLAKDPIEGAKDASQLPLRLPVSDAQRRYAIAVSAAAE